MTIKGRRPRKTEGRVSWRRHNCAICGAEVARRHRIGEIERQRKEEQKE